MAQKIYFCSIFLQNSAGCATDSGICQRKLIILIEPDKFVLQNGLNGVELYHNDALVTIPSSVKGLIVEHLSSRYVMATHAGLDFRLVVELILIFNMLCM